MAEFINYNNLILCLVENHQTACWSFLLILKCLLFGLIMLTQSYKFAFAENNFFVQKL